MSQENNITPTVPLEKEIEVEIFSIDSTSLALYWIYEFTYLTKRKEIKARFWSNTSDTTFELGLTSLKLCRIIEMKIEDGSTIRGCAFYNGYFVLQNDTVVRNFEFSEYGESPTLKLCSSD